MKLGPEGVKVCLRAGVNDLGGTLMNESISRAAGAAHGQEMTPAMMEELIRSADRSPRVRTTLYATSTRNAERAASHRGGTGGTDGTGGTGDRPGQTTVF